MNTQDKVPQNVILAKACIAQTGFDILTGEDHNHGTVLATIQDLTSARRMAENVAAALGAKLINEAEAVRS
jgi:hypothetical protein